MRAMLPAVVCCVLFTGWGTQFAGAADPPKKGYVGMQITQNGAGEVVIEMIVADSPADKAGLMTGDVIVKVANVAAKDVQGVIKTITSFSPGDTITVEVRRDGKEKAIKVTLGERPGGID